jgi:hypothetical protein
MFFVVATGDSIATDFNSASYSEEINDIGVYMTD